MAFQCPAAYFLCARLWAPPVRGKGSAHQDCRSIEIIDLFRADVRTLAISKEAMMSSAFRRTLPARPNRGSLAWIVVRPARRDSILALDGEASGEPLHFEWHHGAFRSLAGISLDGGDSLALTLVITRPSETDTSVTQLTSSRRKSQVPGRQADARNQGRSRQSNHRRHDPRGGSCEAGADQAPEPCSAPRAAGPPDPVRAVTALLTGLTGFRPRARSREAAQAPRRRRRARSRCPSAPRRRSS